MQKGNLLVAYLVGLFAERAVSFCPPNSITAVSQLDSRWLAQSASPMIRKASYRTRVCLARMSTALSVEDSLSEARRIKIKEEFLLLAKAGPKNGVGCTPEQRKEIESKLDALTELNPTKVR